MVTRVEEWDEGMVREYMRHMYTPLRLQWTTDWDYRTVRGALFSVVWRPGWEGSLGENGFMYTYG